MKMPETIRAAFVIGRRDFTATVLSKTFLFFLLGPLFPIIFGFAFGGIGAQADRNLAPPTVAVIGDQADYDLLVRASQRLSPMAADGAPLTLRYATPEPNLASQRTRLLESQSDKLLGVLDGGLAAPHFTGAVNADGRTIRQLDLFIDEARRIAVERPVNGPPMQVTLAGQSGGSIAFARSITARAGQGLLFFLTVLLAGMLLSQLIEEKSNKAIEVLAAAVPVDAIFLGKLFAMLAMSLIGITVWISAGALAINVWASNGLHSLPDPAVGWPAFLTLGFLYYSMNYLLIGATFLGIGAHAATVREVQTMSMPVTMGQLMLFGFAQLAVGRPTSAEAIGAAIFPLSSPFAMIARAAEVDQLWPHLVALAWQALWVALIIRLAARLFRRSVLKSGKSFHWPWQRRRASAA